MTLSGTTALIFALGVWMTPTPAELGAIGITRNAETQVEAARQRRFPKCTRVKRAPCEMLHPEEESSDAV